VKQFIFHEFTSYVITGGLSSFATLTFVAAVHAMQPPEPMGNRFYGWLYRFLQNLCTNKDKL
jgi:hypothetical protein